MSVNVLIYTYFYLASLDPMGVIPMMIVVVVVVVVGDLTPGNHLR